MDKLTRCYFFTWTKTSNDNPNAYCYVPYCEAEELQERIRELEKDNEELKKYIESANKTHLNMSEENLRLKEELNELRSKQLQEDK